MRGDLSPAGRGEPNIIAIPSLITLFLPGQLALAAGVFAFVPLDELAVLYHVSGDHGHGILAVVVEGDFSDDRIAVLHITELVDNLLAVWTRLLDAIQDHVHRRIGEGAIGLGRIVIFLGVVSFHEELAARQLVGRRAFAEGKGAFGQWSEPLDVGVGYDAG